MGCDWIKFKECYYGYGIKFRKVFDKTRFAIDSDYYSSVFEEYENYTSVDEEIGKKDFYNDFKIEYDCSSLKLLKTEFEEYMDQKHPELKNSKRKPILAVTCDNFSGTYESVGHSNSIWIVWGYELCKDMFNTKESDVDGMSTNSVNLDFPNDSKSIYADYCVKKEDADENAVTEIKNKFQQSVEQNIFASLRGC